MKSFIKSKKYNRILKEKEKEESYKKDFFLSGKLRFEVPLVGGVENGLSKTYYTTGELKKKTVPYKNGKKQGDCNEYYKSGVLKSTTPYKNGKMHGVVKTWHYSKKNEKVKI